MGPFVDLGNLRGLKPQGALTTKWNRTVTLKVACYGETSHAGA
jgi:hypothetical protein